MRGYVKATTNLNQYVIGDDWFEFGWVGRLTLTRRGSFDDQGDVSWTYNKCPTNKDCKDLPTEMIVFPSDMATLRFYSVVSPVALYMASLLVVLEDTKTKEM